MSSVRIVAHFALFKSIFAYEITSISICQLDSAKLHKLFWRGIQFEFSRNHRFHMFIYSKISPKCQEMKADDNPKTPPMPKPPKKEGPFIPRMNDGGILGRHGEFLKNLE
jgi:hypothetical protein